MILTGQGMCLPSPSTIQELFFVARDANIIPDISLDPVLTTYLSLDSSAALRHHYAFSQRSMTLEQQSEFRLNLTNRVGGSSRVIHGGIGVVALALSMLFDQVALQVRGQESAEANESSPQRPQAKMIFGISSSSRIGWIIQSYLHLLPTITNNQDEMAENTELFDDLLTLELLDHYERMTNKKRMSSVSMQQWLVGAAFHVHLRIHQVRLGSVPVGSAMSLRWSYKSGLSRLIQGYAAYLNRNIRETAAPGPRKTRTNGPRQANADSRTNLTCSTEEGLLSPGNSTGGIKESTTPRNVTSNMYKHNGSSEDTGTTDQEAKSEAAADGRTMLNCSSGYSNEEELGLLVIEPGRSVSHRVQHHPCESPAIQDALAIRIINTQDLEQNRNFFRYAEKVFRGLLRQRDNFELNQTENVHRSSQRQSV